MSTTNGKIYLTALRSLERLEVQYVPRNINTTRDSNPKEVEVVGRNDALDHYTGGKSSITLELDFCAADENREDVISKCRWLESLTYSDGDNGPEKVRLTFGNMFKPGLAWTVVSVNVNYTRFSEQFNFLPIQAFARVVLKPYFVTDLQASDVKWT